MKYLKMNNGLTIPVLGTGTNTFGKENNDFFAKITYDTKELSSAIKLGYRLIDTAIYYRNEAVIGKAVRESNIDRSEFFITSKIPEKKEFIETDESVKYHVEQSLKALDIGYIDLYLMHFPLETNQENLRVWRVLEEFVKRGLIKSIGVSNFNEDQLAYLIKHASIKPVLNQFQSYPKAFLPLITAPPPINAPETNIAPVIIRASPKYNFFIYTPPFYTIITSSSIKQTIEL